LDIGVPEVLAECAGDVGMPVDRVLEFLHSDDGTAEVQAELRMAAEAEITAVPTFVLDGKWAIPGAQEPDTFVNVVHRLLERRAG
jgi:predicted DsbA family dithiol-disulfide isomerase